MTIRSDLLQPSLSGAQPIPQPTFSTQAHFFMGFFAGPLPTLVFIFMGLNRMGKDRERLPVSILTTFVFLILFALNIYLASTGVYQQWIVGASDLSIMRRVNNLLGLLTVGAFYLLHLKNFRMSKQHPEAASPWKAVGVSLTIGFPIQLASYILIGIH